MEAFQVIKEALLHILYVDRNIACFVKFSKNFKDFCSVCAFGLAAGKAKRAYTTMEKNADLRYVKLGLGDGTTVAVSIRFLCSARTMSTTRVTPMMSETTQSRSSQIVRSGW